MAGNYLYYGDNLDILRHSIDDESVDLIYLDPPFNSNRNYNVLFQEKSGEASPSQIRAFTDTWEWDRSAETAFDELIDSGPHNVATMITAMRELVGRNDMMAYLVMMAQRMVELHRVLKPTGSLYLHCDPTASHYLKILLDTVFGKQHFQNEIIWWYRKWSKSPNRFLRNHDVIFFYAKQTEHNFNIQYVPLAPSTLKRFGGKRQDFADEERTRKITTDEESAGAFMPDVWSIPSLAANSNEKLGYPTQKPLVLLERIIAASSNPGDVILDPFCGCGTAIVAAQKLQRSWIGIDITHLSIALMKNRLVDAFGETVKFEVHGEPEDVGSARMLAETDRYEFQRWANSLVNAHPLGGQDKKGADRGIDGVIRFVDEANGKPKHVLVQVKSGHVGSPTMRDLKGTLDREKAAMALLVTLEPATRPMRQEAVEAGSYHSPGWNRDFPRVQILTIEELLTGTKADLPPMRATFERAQRMRRASSHTQPSLLDD